MRVVRRCPQCGFEERSYLNPIPTVDVIAEIYGHGIVLILRRNPPRGWALPGGFVDYGESLEAAALREFREETGLTATLIRQFHVYSQPNRDPRQHTITTVFVARATGVLRASDDALEAGIFSRDRLPQPLAFDHADILEDYFSGRY
jgi:ADP-ribose pyrophosphatase YjhB (NUDIX family)